MPTGTGRKLKILVVDDEEIVRSCIRGLLTYEGHDVQIAVNAESALAIFQKDTFDVVFLDYSMPGMKGDELAAAMKVVAPHQPIVMITGNTPLRKSVPGVNLLISKPVVLGDLKNAINTVCGEKSFAE
jgi:CheY-like chemotaxis protein